ncbi:MAG: ABC-2 transporter permease [Bacteroidaceae bacterium]|nr:ABC-2 transporter permease [Bacteroidaceae bacterium]
MMKKYCRYYLFCAVGFTVLSVMSAGNMFFIFYPCLLCGMIPVNLIGYDERSRWMQYSGTMPYTKAQIVSGKYLIGLFSQLALLLLMGAAHAVKMMLAGDFVPGEFAVLMLLMLIVSTLSSSISLPFIFKLGVEKGRTAYYVMVGFVCAASFIVSNLFKGQLGTEIKPNLVLAILAVVGIGIYVFSWYMSIVFYKKREIQ